MGARSDGKRSRTRLTSLAPPADPAVLPSADQPVLPPPTPVTGLDLAELVRTLDEARRKELDPYLDELARARREAESEFLHIRLS